MVEKYTIDDESEADAYLKDLLAKDEFRSIDEVKNRSKELIKDESLRIYFINKAREILLI
jgi:hypothetical protein